MPDNKIRKHMDTEYRFRAGEFQRIYSFRTMPEQLDRPLQFASKNHAIIATLTQDTQEYLVIDKNGNTIDDLRVLLEE